MTVTHQLSTVMDSSSCSGLLKINFSKTLIFALYFSIFDEKLLINPIYRTSGLCIPYRIESMTATHSLKLHTQNYLIRGVAKWM
jgi:hypothetical protein